MSDRMPMPPTWVLAVLVLLVSIAEWFYLDDFDNLVRHNEWVRRAPLVSSPPHNLRAFNPSGRPSFFVANGSVGIAVVKSLHFSYIRDKDHDGDPCQPDAATLSYSRLLTILQEASAEVVFEDSNSIDSCTMTSATRRALIPHKDLNRVEQHIIATLNATDALHSQRTEQWQLDTRAADREVELVTALNQQRRRLQRMRELYTETPINSTHKGERLNILLQSEGTVLTLTSQLDAHRRDMQETFSMISVSFETTDVREWAKSEQRRMAHYNRRFMWFTGISTIGFVLLVVFGLLLLLRAASVLLPSKLNVKYPFKGRTHPLLWVLLLTIVVAFCCLISTQHEQSAVQHMDFHHGSEGANVQTMQAMHFKGFNAPSLPHRHLGGRMNDLAMPERNDDTASGGQNLQARQQRARQVVHTTSMELAVAFHHIKSAAHEVHAIVNEVGGYISSDVSEFATFNGLMPMVHMTIQVPSNTLDATVAKLSHVGKARRIQRRAVEVSAIAADLDVQIQRAERELQVFEAFYNETQGPDSKILIIERLMGFEDTLVRLKEAKARLKHSVEYAEIKVDMFEEPPSSNDKPSSFLQTTGAFVRKRIHLAQVITLILGLLAAAVVLHHWYGILRIAIVSFPDYSSRPTSSSTSCLQEESRSAAEVSSSA